MPIVQITLFCLCIGRVPQDLPVGFVNNDEGNSLFALNLGNDIIDAMDPSIIDKRNYTNFHSAYRDLKRSVIWAFVLVEANFTQELASVYLSKEFTTHSFTNKLRVYIDNTSSFTPMFARLSPIALLVRL